MLHLHAGQQADEKRYDRRPGALVQDHLLTAQEGSGGSLILALEGRVVDEGGEPAAGIKVTCCARNSDALDWLTGQQRPESITQFEMREIVTERSGDLGCAGLSAGRYVSQVSSPRRGGVVRIEQQVEDSRAVGGLRLVIRNSAQK